MKKILLIILFFPIIIFSQSYEGTFQTGLENVVFKNVRCVAASFSDLELTNRLNQINQNTDYWTITVINRNTSYRLVSFLFYTVDSDGDPLETFERGSFNVSAKSRRDLVIQNIDCNKTPFTKITRVIN